MCIKKPTSHNRHFGGKNGNMGHMAQREARAGNPLHANRGDAWPINISSQDGKWVPTPIKLNAYKPKPSQRSNLSLLLTLTQLLHQVVRVFLYFSSPFISLSTPNFIITT
jgi:hypothetical protein